MSGKKEDKCKCNKLFAGNHNNKNWHWLREFFGANKSHCSSEGDGKSVGGGGGGGDGDNAPTEGITTN